MILCRSTSRLSLSADHIIISSRQQPAYHEIPPHHILSELQKPSLAFTHKYPHEVSLIYAVRPVGALFEPSRERAIKAAIMP